MTIRRLVFWLLLVVLAFFGVRFVLTSFFSSGGAPVVVDVLSGASADQVAELLVEKNVIGSAFWYRVYGWFDGAVGRPKAGDYNLTVGESYRAIARQLALGPARDEVSVRVIEGWTVDDEIVYLQKEKNIAPEKTAVVVGRSIDRSSFDPLLRLGWTFLSSLPAKRSLEGYLFPETYRVWKDQLPDGLIEKQLQEFGRRFGGVTVTGASAPLTSLDDVVTLASIIEKEVRGADDQKIVAGIFLQRLKIGMALQSDATLSYALGSGVRASADDLATNSPYNTYKHRGLPPSPICNPSESAIRAVLDPTSSPYHYFLTDKSGKVLYARTLHEHVANRRKAGY